MDHRSSTAERPRQDRRRFLALAGGIAAAGLAPVSSRTGAVPSADQSSTSPAANVRPIFSYPTLDGSTDLRHEESFKRLLADAVPGTSVYFSIYIFTRENIAEAFVAAADRGVDLNLIIDERSENSTATGILRDNLDADSLTIVSNAGVGNRINHNKFLALEELQSGARNVVWQSSSNFTGNQIYYHNSTVVVRNDESLFDVYRSYWEDLADESFQDLSYNRTETTDTATAYFSPRDDYDPYIEALENVVPSWQTKIHFVQSIWTDSREAETQLVQGRLTELAEEGAEIRVVMQERDNRIAGLLDDAGADVVQYPEAAGTQVHSKNMLIESDFETEDGGTERRREVWTGTQNLSRPGLRRNDETMLRIVDDYLYNEFLHDWERIRLQAVRARSGSNPGSDGGDGPATPTEANEPAGTPTATASDTDSSEPTSEETASGSGPGFGALASTVGVLGGTAYAALRRSETDDAE